MSETYGPSSSGAGANFLDGLWQEMMSQVWQNGVMKNGEGTDLAVTAPGGAMSVNVGVGRAMVQGLFYRNDASKAITISAADPSNPRIDLIILSATLAAPSSVAAQVLTGTPSGSPSAPALTQTGSTWQIALAQIAVGAGVTQITSGNVTDVRGYGGLYTAVLPAAAAGARIFIQHTQPSGANKYDVWIQTPFS